MKRGLSSFTAALVGLAASSAVAHGQTGAAEFDHSRAILRDSAMFEPFYVEETIPLKEALANGTLRKVPIDLKEPRSSHRFSILRRCPASDTRDAQRLSDAGDSLSPVVPGVGANLV